MIQVSEVLSQVRLRLADGGKQKWKDDRLVYLFNEALQQIALRSRLFVTRGYVPVEHRRTFYNLSDKVLKLSRIAYKDDGSTGSYVLPLISHSEMDELGREGNFVDNRRGTSERVSPFNSDFGNFPVGIEWDDDTGERPLAIIVSNQQPGNFRLYPIPEFTDPTVTAPVNIEDTDEAGILTGAEQLAAEPLDTVTGENALMPFGGLNTQLPRRYLIVHYIEHPGTFSLTPPNNVFNFNKQYETPIENYIVFKALRDQIDTYDAQRAQTEYAFFLEALENLENERTSDFRESPTVNLSPNWTG